MSVDAISFSAHADFDQTSNFLDVLRPQHVILVHGEANEMGRLRKALERQGETTKADWTVHSPKVAQTIDVSLLSSDLPKSVVLFRSYMRHSSLFTLSGTWRKSH